MTFERREEMIRRDEREEGRKAGLQSCVFSALSNGLSEEEVSKILSIPYDDVMKASMELKLSNMGSDSINSVRSHL